MVYCRALFELFYKDYIYYNSPLYIIKLECGENEWDVFLQSLII